MGIGRIATGGVAFFSAGLALACGAHEAPTRAPATAASTERPRAPLPPPAASTPSKAAPTPAKPGRGLLSVHTDPPGAMVIIEGGVMAQTPLDRVDIAAGKHQMLIAMPGYEAVGAMVNIVAGEHTVQEVILSRGDAPRTAGEIERGGCSASLCQRDCFQEHAHCENDCGFCTDCGSPVDGSAVDCSVCLSCKETCRQMQRACERGCEACD